jgi:prefoldin subunit 5
MDTLEKQIMEIRQEVALQGQRLTQYERDVSELRTSMKEVTGTIGEVRHSLAALTVKVGIGVAVLVAVANFVAPMLFGK